MIISHSSLGGNGRLGNQLFQIASTLGLAERYGAEAHFPRWKYEQYFEPIPHGEMMTNTITERDFHYYDWNLTGSCDIQGFFQSEKYFGSAKLRIKKEYVDKARQNPIFQKETICIHVRRGDYVGNSAYYQLTINYYIGALIAYFPNWQEMNILVVSDDIEYCKVHFGCLPNATFGGRTDIEDMILGTQCDHFIISNSSFGWWVAYLGEKPGSKIIHCGRLHSGRLKGKGCEDYYPSRWISFKREGYKLDLLDMTFTIPVKFDHKDRKDNLALSLCLLQMSFASNYIVCEQGGKWFEQFKEYSNYMRSTATVFHRTKMLNEMCRASSTPYIANWDCDVIVPPLQVYLAAMTLRQGADMVYPYGGAFARMPRAQWFPVIEKGLDIGLVGNTVFRGRTVEEHSAGGAVFWNKDSFIRAGMENEHMISFGPEDGERLDRAKCLGLNVIRIDGTLFHMNHYVGPDSSPKNPHFHANAQEQRKIHNMSREQLEEYIATWKWVR